MTFANPEKLIANSTRSFSKPMRRVANSRRLTANQLKGFTKGDNPREKNQTKIYRSESHKKQNPTFVGFCFRIL